MTKTAAEGQHDKTAADGQHGNTAGAPEHGEAPATSGVAALHHLLASGVPPLGKVATILAKYPAERDALVTELQRVCGLGYTRAVIDEIQSRKEDSKTDLRFDPDPVVIDSLEVGAISDAASVTLTAEAATQINRVDFHPLQNSTADDFIIDEPLPHAVAPGAPLKLGVRFRPSKVGNQAALLRVHGYRDGQPITQMVKVASSGSKPKNEHVDQRDESVARYQAHQISSPGTALPTQTPLYVDMLAAVLAAQRMTGNRTEEPRARQVLAPVQQRLEELRTQGDVKLRQFGAGFVAGTIALDSSRAAVDDWVQKLSLGSTIETSHLVREFEIGSEVIRFLTGERKEAKDLEAFGHVSRLVAVGAAIALAAPAAVMTAWEAAGLLTAAGDAVANTAYTWALAHPIMAAELISSAVGVGGTVGSWDDLVEILHDPKETAFLLMQIGLELMHIHSARRMGGGRTRASNQEPDHTPEPVSTTEPRQVRTAAGGSGIHAMLPEGAVVVRADGDRWVVYRTANGKQFVMFRANQARTLTEANPGRNMTKESSAAINTAGNAFVLEGRHRAIGAATGDVIPVANGGVAGDSGVLNYPFKDIEITEAGVPISDLTIDYSQPDVPPDQADRIWKERHEKGSK